MADLTVPDSENTKEADRLVSGAALAVNAYSAFLVGACHSLGSPLGALLSNVALVREDLADLRKTLAEGEKPEATLELVERSYADLGDALKLIDRLRGALIEVRSLESDAPGEGASAFLPVFESTLRFATSSAFRGARVTSQVAPGERDDDYVVKVSKSLLLRLILGMFALAASVQRGRTERSTFRIEASSKDQCVHLRIIGEGVGAVLDEDLRVVFSGWFEREGGRLSVTREAELLMVSGEFPR